VWVDKGRTSDGPRTLVKLGIIGPLIITVLKFDATWIRETRLRNYVQAKSCEIPVIILHPLVSKLSNTLTAASTPAAGHHRHGLLTRCSEAFLEVED